jgi:hypothetical protein
VFMGADDSFARLRPLVVVGEHGTLVHQRYSSGMHLQTRTIRANREVLAMVVLVAIPEAVVWGVAVVAALMFGYGTLWVVAASPAAPAVLTTSPGPGPERQPHSPFLARPLVAMTVALAALLALVLMPTAFDHFPKPVPVRLDDSTKSSTPARDFLASTPQIFRMPASEAAPSRHEQSHASVLSDRATNFQVWAIWVAFFVGAFQSGMAFSRSKYLSAAAFPALLTMCVIAFLVR